MTLRLPRLLNVIEAWILDGVDAEEAERIHTEIYAPPPDPKSMVRRGRPGRQPSPRRRPITAAQARAVQAQAAAWDAEMGSA